MVQGRVLKRHGLKTSGCLWRGIQGRVAIVSSFDDFPGCATFISWYVPSRWLDINKIILNVTYFHLNLISHV